MDSDVQVGRGLLGGSGQVPGGGPGGQLGVQQGEGGQEGGQPQQLGGGEGGGGVPRDVGQPSGHLEEAQPCLQACQEVQDQRPPQRRSSQGGAGCRCSPRCSPGTSQTPTLPGNQSQQGVSCQQPIPFFLLILNLTNGRQKPYSEQQGAKEGQPYSHWTSYDLEQKNNEITKKYEENWQKNQGVEKIST